MKTKKLVWKRVRTSDGWAKWRECKVSPRTTLTIDLLRGKYHVWDGWQRIGIFNTLAKAKKFAQLYCDNLKKKK